MSAPKRILRYSPRDVLALEHARDRSPRGICVRPVEWIERLAGDPVERVRDDEFPRSAPPLWDGSLLWTP